MTEHHLLQALSKGDHQAFELLFKKYFKSYQLINQYYSNGISILNIENPINILKIGGEYRFKDISFRAGYYYQTKNQDTNINEDQAVTLGIGFDFGASNLSLSLIKFEKNKDFVLRSVVGVF